MIKELGQPGIENQKAAVRALIGRLQPGEMLQIGERAVARYYYARVIPGNTHEQRKHLEEYCPDFGALTDIQIMIQQMVQAGELLETNYRWQWTKPQPR